LDFVAHPSFHEYSLYHLYPLRDAFRDSYGYNRSFFYGDFNGDLLMDADSDIILNGHSPIFSNPDSFSDPNACLDMDSFSHCHKNLDANRYLFLDPNGVWNRHSDPFGYCDIHTDDYCDKYYHTISNRGSQSDFELDLHSDIYSLRYSDFFPNPHG
jgi:hypothetical protein